MSHEFMEQKRSQARGPNRTPEGKIGALVVICERCSQFRRAGRESFTGLGRDQLGSRAIPSLTCAISAPVRGPDERDDPPDSKNENPLRCRPSLQLEAV